MRDVGQVDDSHPARMARAPNTQRVILSAAFPVPKFARSGGITCNSEADDLR